jgi:hypothetical protein
VDWQGTITLNETSPAGGEWDITDGHGFTASNIPNSATDDAILAALGGSGATSNYGSGTATLESVTGSDGGPWAFDVADSSASPSWPGFTPTGTAATGATQTITFASVQDGDTLTGADWSILFYALGSPNDPIQGGSGTCVISPPITLCQAVGGVISQASTLVTATSDDVSVTTVTTVEKGSGTIVNLGISTTDGTNIELGTPVDGTPDSTAYPPTWSITQNASPAIAAQPEIQSVPYPGGVAGAQWQLNGETLAGNCTTSQVQTAMDTALGSGVATVTQPDGAGNAFIVTWNSDGPQSLLSLTGEATAATTQHGSPVVCGSVLKSAMISFEKVSA